VIELLFDVMRYCTVTGGKRRRRRRKRRRKKEAY